MQTENEGQPTQGNSEQTQQQLSPEAIQLQEERRKTLEYAERRLNLTDAEGNPLKKEVADQIIRSVQLEATTEMAEILKAQAEGEEVDPVKLERATFLIAKANDAAYRQEKNEDSSLEEILKDMHSSSKFTNRSEDLASLLYTPSSQETPQEQQKTPPEPGDRAQPNQEPRTQE